MLSAIVFEQECVGFLCPMHLISHTTVSSHVEIVSAMGSILIQIHNLQLLKMGFFYYRVCIVSIQTAETITTADSAMLKDRPFYVC